MRTVLYLCVVMTSGLLTTAQPSFNVRATPPTVSASVLSVTTGLPGQSVRLPPAQPVSPSVMQLSIVTMIAGQYNNVEQYQDDVTKNVTAPDKHGLIEESYVPAFVSIFGPGVPTVYHERRVNNETEPVRKVLIAFARLSDCAVRMSVFEIANSSRVSATKEGLRALEGLQPSELGNRPECDSVCEKADTDFYVCFVTTDQCLVEGPDGAMVRPDGLRNITCSGMSFTEIWRRVPSGQIVGGVRTPFVLKKTGNLYPVPVGSFTSKMCFTVPCTDKSKTQDTGPSWDSVKSEMSYNKKDDKKDSNAV